MRKARKNRGGRRASRQGGRKADKGKHYKVEKKKWDNEEF